MAANAALQRLGRNTPSRAATQMQMSRQTASHEIPAMPESPTPPARHAPKEVATLTAYTSLNALTTSDCSDCCSGLRTDHCLRSCQTPSLIMDVTLYILYLSLETDLYTSKRFVTPQGLMSKTCQCYRYNFSPRV